jgi:hypothetical protein
MQTLLDHVKPADIMLDPFPHIVIKDALNRDLYSALASGFPSLDLLGVDSRVPSNTRCHSDARQVLNNDRFASVWQEFVKTHTSSEFYKTFIRLFRNHILASNPELEKSLGPLEDLTVGTRRIDSHPQVDVLLDALIAVNTPVTVSPSSVRKAHVDLPNKLFTSLFYMRDPNDKSEGGDLELYRLKEPGLVNYRKRELCDMMGISEMPESSVECVKKVTYDSNVFVLFINSQQSLHGVSVRSVTDYPRRFVCVLGQVEKDLFDINSFQCEPE